MYNSFSTKLLYKAELFEDMLNHYSEPTCSIDLIKQERKTFTINNVMDLIMYHNCILNTFYYDDNTYNISNKNYNHLPLLSTINTDIPFDSKLYLDIVNKFIHNDDRSLMRILQSILLKTHITAYYIKKVIDLYESFLANNTSINLDYLKMLLKKLEIDIQNEALEYILTKALLSQFKLFIIGCIHTYSNQDKYFKYISDYMEHDELYSGYKSPNNTLAHLNNIQQELLLKILSTNNNQEKVTKYLNPLLISNDLSVDIVLSSFNNIIKKHNILPIVRTYIISNPRFVLSCNSFSNSLY